ncbi:hypothetical protein CPB83DRAFT_840668 [Crepidotus variabilis]|uniref:F-box domain-containing protein n=1 Tax=Crepidotus variabilis TaxID=179855 RepID=A0A9P6E481_9AGAR|nr:hypothetical protein CPB83DRAFT_840668 [Crepidotus variabilis]
MELTQEAYHDIIKNVGTRADLCSLCWVSRGFRSAAEKALYNTVSFGQDNGTPLLCRTLSNSPRLAALVVALTISLEDDEDDEVSDEDEAASIASTAILPKTFWHDIANVLQATSNLHYLHVRVNHSANPAVAWILRRCDFQLRKFHSDFDWDDELVKFLNNQKLLEDLYLSDYREPKKRDDSADESVVQNLLESKSMPFLSYLECTFSEAAIAMVPGRPVTHLKTCFSRTELGAKRDEMYDLLSKVALSTCHLHSLDLADSSYTEQFSTELLAAITTMRSLTSELRYLGTLVLPVDGQERLQIYALLRRLPKIRCVEFEVSEWKPQPSSASAQRALAGELQLYVPSITRVVFVLDFDRSVVSTSGHIWRVDLEIATEYLWRHQ